MTQAQVAQRLAMSQGHYSRIERLGHTSRETAVKITAMFPDLSEMEVLFPERFVASGDGSGVAA